MNTRALGEMALIAYNSVDKMADVLTKAVNNKSFYTAGSEFSGNLLAAFDAIASLIDRKKMLVNLRLIIDTALVKLSPQYLKVLCLKFCDRFSNNQICDAMEISERTFYRKLNTGIEHFGRNLFSGGLNEDRCKKLFAKEAWLENIYNHLNDGKTELKVFSLRDERNKLKCV